MPLIMTTAPAAHPVTVADAKSFTRVDYEDEDALIDTLIGAAVEHVQQVTGRQFVVATFRLSLRAFPHDCLIRLPRSPLVEVVSVKYLDTDGALQTLVENTDYLVDSAAEPATIEPVLRWPAIGNSPNAVQVTFSAGYPDTEDSPAISTVPNRALVAVKALVSHWYDNRTPIAETGWHTAPFHVTRLLAGLRVWGTL